MAGRRPAHELNVTQQGAPPVDFAVANAGSAEEELDCDVVVRWAGPQAIACDALPGWSVSSTASQAIFGTTEHALRLPPGTQAGIGWIRFAQAAQVHTQLIFHAPNLH
jgi:hypothetical protein